MKRFVVGYLNFFDNDLVLEIVEAETVKEAIGKHSKIAPYEETVEWLNDMEEDLESIKTDFFNGDQVIDVIELTT